MILIWELSGGLGNQLYQYSKSLEIKNKYKDIKIFYVYFKRLHKKSHEYPRLNEIFKKKIKVYSGFKILILKYLFSKILSKRNSFFYYHSDNWWINQKEVENNNLKICKIAYVSSLFQSLPDTKALNYIKNNFIFKFNDKLEYAVLHIRLGDYLNKKNKKEIGLMSNKYYQAVYKVLKDKTKKVFIITNGNKNEVEKILEISKNDLQIVTSNNDLDDFQLIINASYIGMPNSSFSIWGAYLSNAKIVYVPKIWLPSIPSSLIRTKSLYFKKWNIVSE